MLRFREERTVLQSLNYLNDPHLPHLVEALDGNNVRHFYQAMIADEVDTRISSFQVVRVRYRRAQRCIIQYEMTLRLTDDSLQTHWLVGYLYANKKKLRARADRLEKMSADCCPVDGLPPVVVIEEIGLLLQRFPFDRRLPTLAPFYFNINQEISDHLVKLLGSNDWKLERLDTQLARWRVGLSAVVSLTLCVRHRCTGEFRCHNLFAKLVATRTDPGIKSRLQHSESSDGLPFEIPRTLLSIPQQGFTVQARAEGLALESMLSQGVEKLADATRLASVLANWHTTGDSLHKCYSKDIFERVLERSVRVLSTATPACSLRLEGLAKSIRERMNHAIYCPAHLDLKPEHIFFCADGITLIDIDSAADADPMIDIAILYARLLHARALYDLPGTASQRFASQLMNTYHKQVPSDWWDNFSVCYAWALLKMAVHLFVCQRPDWPGWIHCFVSEAELAMRLTEGELPLLFDCYPAIPARKNEPSQTILSRKRCIA